MVFGKGRLKLTIQEKQKNSVIWEVGNKIVIGKEKGENFWLFGKIETYN